MDSRAERFFEKDYALWLARIESRAMLPMKIGMLAVSLVYWLWNRDWAPPPTAVFGLFFMYGATTLALAWFFWRDRIATDQVRPMAYASYFADLAFITALIWFDSRMPPALSLAAPVGGDYHLLYLLLVFRGFALFRTTAENLAVALLVTLLFVVSLFWRQAPETDVTGAAFMARVGFVWGLMLLAVVIVNLVGKQQQEVLRVRERLVKAEGLAALGEMAAGVAHEINNPIGIIKTYAEYLKKAVPETDERHDDFATIEKEASRCEGIVRRMLDFARPDIQEMKPVRIQDVAEEVVGFVTHGKKGGEAVRIDLHVEGTPPAVLADEGQIKQAILNIVMNARQIAGEDGGAGIVILTVRQLAGPRAPVQITVHDDGPGIAPEDAERAFEPFFTKRKGGTGLGLAITRRIVEAHGGSIEIWPAANGGTTCAVSLPIAETGG